MLLNTRAKSQAMAVVTTAYIPEQRNGQQSQGSQQTDENKHIKHIKPLSSDAIL